MVQSWPKMHQKLFEICLYTITNVVKDKSHPRIILSLEKLTLDKTCASSNLEEINIHSLEVFARKTFLKIYFIDIFTERKG